MDRPRRCEVTDDVRFLRAQAKKCRWLAERIGSSDVAETLLQMARDYDERAADKGSGTEETKPT